MPQPPAHETRLHKAHLSWQSNAGPARFATRLEGAIENKRLNVEYEFFRNRGGSGIRAHVGNVSMPLDEPVDLRPVTITKPWGQEIWYTGMEARGESQVATPSGSLPISGYLDLAPKRLCNQQPIVLLKILDPRADPVLGDLYLETHATKHEVYVVTRLDPTAWPDGIGAIRMGINQQLRQQFSSDQAFRAAYLKAVQDYERVRRGIDEDSSEPSAAAASEHAARKAMNSFTSVLPLRVGDVVNVPPWLPHSLQHGVRVVEFQTPTYERFIISFAQRVVTQDHWDSDHAIAHMNLEPPHPPVSEIVAPGIEQIARANDFCAWRVELEPGRSVAWPIPLAYAICMSLDGSVTVNGMARQAEQACFVPGSALPMTLGNSSRLPATCLVASAAP